MSADHYFSPHPTSPGRPLDFTTAIRGRRFSFHTDAGVFSRDGIDRGTRLLLDCLEIPAAAHRLVDLGCGYGPIGLVMAALAPEAFVYMIDPNKRACELARENALRNDITNVRVVQGEGLTGVDSPVDLVALNPPIRAGKLVVYDLLSQSAAHLGPEGELWTVIRTSQGAKSLERELRRLFAAVTEVEKGGGFRVYRSRPTGN